MARDGKVGEYTEAMPPGWEPPYPAWSAEAPSDTSEVVIGCYGVQLAKNDEPATRIDAPSTFFDAPDGPQNVEWGRFTDRTGCNTDVAIAYWSNAAHFDSWQSKSGFAEWWLDPARIADSSGRFREIMRIPVGRLETIFSSEHLQGVAKGGHRVAGPIKKHAYWGAMRDRIPDSAGNGFESPHGSKMPQLLQGATRAARRRVQVPENLAVIRSGQNWAACAEGELKTYQESVHPVLIAGLEFLRDHPFDTGCCEMRFANEATAKGKPLQQSHGLGYFLTLAHLERWVSSHPTHLAIYDRFMEMVQKHNSQINLKLWHEVAVLPGKGQEFEYINCHSETGLLPYFDSVSF
jgi:aldoxime dehydratase